MQKVKSRNMKKHTVPLPNMYTESLGVRNIGIVKQSKNNGKTIAVKVDSKGRMVLPQAVRESLGVHAGDVLYVRPQRNGAIIMKGDNPFDGLAKQALREYKAGRTMSLEEFAHREGVELD